MVQQITNGRRDGGAERRITMLAVAIAACYVALALATILLPATARLGAWLPLHLLLAGAAGTAISGVMPFFSAAVSGAPPPPRVLRGAAVVLVAAGAAVATFGRLAPDAGTANAVAGIGGLVYLCGLVIVGIATVLPLRRALGSRRYVIGTIYGVAVLNVIVGVSLSTLLLLNWTPVINAWGTLKPAHAWLNLFGFVSLVIAGSLLHLLPTVASARIARTRSSMATFALLAVGPPIAALGFVVAIDALAVIGAGVVFAGGLALGAHTLNVLRARGKWSTDPAWHRFVTWSLIACVGWFIVGVAIATINTISGGATAQGWDLSLLIAPLGIGWVAQVLIGSWSHLVPAIGPGTQAQHAMQRVTLGRASGLRVVTLNTGVAALLAGTLLDMPMIQAIGLAAAVLTAAGSISLLAIALARSRTGLVASPA